MPSFQVEQFQRAEVVGESATIRIDGRWISEQPEVVSDPVLLIRNGSDLARIEPVAGSDTDIVATPSGEPWGVRFTVPTAAIGSAQAGYALEIAGGLAFALPEPEGTPKFRGLPEAEPIPAPAPDHDFESLNESVHELQARLADERRARHAAEEQLQQQVVAGSTGTDTDRLRRLELMIGELESHIRGPAAGGPAGRVQELELMLAESNEMRSQLEQRIRESEDEAHGLQASLEAARQAYSEARAQALEFEQTAELEALERTRAQERISELRAEVDELAALVRSRTAAPIPPAPPEPAEPDAAFPIPETPPFTAPVSQGDPLAPPAVEVPEPSAEKPAPEGEAILVARRRPRLGLRRRYPPHRQKAPVAVEAPVDAPPVSVPEPAAAAPAEEVERASEDKPATQKSQAQRLLPLLVVLVLVIGAVLSLEANDLIQAPPLNP